MAERSMANVKAGVEGRYGDMDLLNTDVIPLLEKNTT